MRRNQGICAKCGRVFSLESSSEENLCSPCVDVKKAQLKCIPNHNCIICGDRFYTPNHLKRCPSCSHKGYSRKSRADRIYDPAKIIVPKKYHGKRISFEEQERRAEWKRVMDEDGWDHYLRGNKWNKI